MISDAGAGGAALGGSAEAGCGGGVAGGAAGATAAAAVGCFWASLALAAAFLRLM